MPKCFSCASASLRLCDLASRHIADSGQIEPQEPQVLTYLCFFQAFATKPQRIASNVGATLFGELAGLERRFD